MSLDFNQLQSLYDRIVLGAKIVNYKDISYVVKDPGPQERLIGDQVYNEAYDNLERSGVPSKIELEEMLIEKKIWGPELEKEFGGLTKEKERLSKEIMGLEFRSDEKARLSSIVGKINKRLDTLNKYKNTLNNITVDYLANYERYKIYIYLLTTNNNNRVWTSREEFSLAPDNLISYLIYNVYFDNNINEKSIRQLARSEPWRSTWIIANKVGDLFDRPLIYLTDLQRALATWSVIYDNAMESMEPPSNEVMANDDLFDQWLKNQSDKRKSEKGANMKNLPEGQEVGIVVDNIEDAKKVYNLNSPQGLGIIKKREGAIKEKGVLMEGHLPDIKQDLQMRKNQLETQHRLK